jgi:hypothetical protein
MIKNLIRMQQEEAKEKKLRELYEKSQKAKQQMKEKMMREESERFEHDKRV